MKRTFVQGAFLLTQSQSLDLTVSKSQADVDTRPTVFLLLLYPDWSLAKLYTPLFILHNQLILSAFHVPHSHTQSFFIQYICHFISSSKILDLQKNLSNLYYVTIYGVIAVRKFLIRQDLVDKKMSLLLKRNITVCAQVTHYGPVLVYPCCFCACKHDILDNDAWSTPVETRTHLDFWSLICKYFHASSICGL